jgi:hypothetical protein
MAPEEIRFLCISEVDGACKLTLKKRPKGSYGPGAIPSRCGKSLFNGLGKGFGSNVKMPDGYNIN